MPSDGHISQTWIFVHDLATGNFQSWEILTDISENYDEDNKFPNDLIVPLNEAENSMASLIKQAIEDRMATTGSIS